MANEENKIVLGEKTCTHKGCMRRIVVGYELCPQHLSYNKQCPICLEENKNMFTLSCMHAICRGCMDGFVEFLCPLCKSQILNLPGNLVTKIKENAAKYAQEKIQEEHRELLNQETLRVPPFIEVLTAIAFLRQSGIPNRFIPHLTNINIPSNTNYQPGQLCNDFIVSFLSALQTKLGKDDDLEPQMEEESDSVDPFNESNKELDDDEGHILCDGVNIRFLNRDLQTMNIHGID